MDWVYLFGPSALQIAVGFVIAKLFEQLSERRQDRRLAIQISAERERANAQLSNEKERLLIQLSAERERLEIEHRGELRKRMFESRFAAAVQITRLLKGSVQTLRTQMFLHQAAYSEGSLDIEMYRTLRDTTFDRVESAIREGFDAAGSMELFEGISFEGLPHQESLLEVTGAWQAFLREESDFLKWLGELSTGLPPLLPRQELTAKNESLSSRMSEMRAKVNVLIKLTDQYDESVSASIRVLREALAL